MSPLLIVTLAVGMVLAGLVLFGQRASRAELVSLRSTIGEPDRELRDPGGELNELRGELAELGEQVTRIEGLAEELREAIEGSGVAGGTGALLIPYPRRPVRPNVSAPPSSPHGATVCTLHASAVPAPEDRDLLARQFPGNCRSERP